MDEKPVGERLAVTETQIADLYKKLDVIEKDIRLLARGAWVLVAAVAGWASIQLYEDIQVGIANATAPPAAEVRAK